MLLATALLAILHPGYALKGEDSDFPSVSRKEKKAIKKEEKQRKKEEKQLKKEEREERKRQEKQEKERQAARTGGGRRAEGGPYMQWRAIRRLAALALIAEIRRARGAEARRLAAPRR